MNPNLEYIDCPCCSSNRCSVVAHPICHHREAIGGEFTVVECADCGLLYLNPRPDKGSLLACYAVIQGNEAIAATVVAAECSASRVRAWWRKLNYANPLSALIDAGPVIDIGCARGALLKELRARGIESSGIEFDANAVDACRRDGLDVSLADIDRVVLPRRNYRYIVLSHVLEHLVDPVRVLRILPMHLAPGGRILISLPYARSPMRKLFRDAWHGWDPPFHLIHLDRLTAANLCARAALRVDKTLVIGHPEDFTRSFVLKTGRAGRYLVLRAMLWPFFAVGAAFGRGSYLIVSAATANADEAGQNKADLA